MKTMIAMMFSLLLVAGCGVDGAPLRPSLNAGLSLGASGLAPSASVGVRKGPVSLGVAL